jgi:hypothetical protein
VQDARGGPDADGAGPRSDGGSPDHAAAEGGADAGPSLYGDRNLGVSEPYPDSVLIQNGGRFYNVMNPPTPSEAAAKGDGTTDDTPAFLDAFDYLRAAYVAANPTGSATAGFDASNYWIYVPNGTYRVTSTLSYRMTLVSPSFPSDLVRIRIMGESREGVILKLDDNATGFGDASQPKILLEFQHDGTTFNNAPADNVLANVTLSTGSGNAGAIGLWFQGANQTSMHNVKVTSGDGSGHCGMIFQSGSVQGYYRDLTIEGFDYGLCQTVNPEVDSSFEHITLTAQRLAGILVQGGGMSVRRALVDEHTTGASGVEVAKSGAVVFVDESSFVGSSGGGGALEQATTTGEALFLRNVVSSGFAHSVLVAGVPAEAGATIASYASYPSVVLKASTAPPGSLGLPVEDTPLSPWGNPSSDWADVDAFGAMGDGTTDDTAAIQAAMSSGKSVVVFPKPAYLWKTTVTIPASVLRVDFMFSDVQGSLSIAEPSSQPVRLTYHPGYAGMELHAARPVVLSDWSGDFGNPTSIATNVYLENVSNIGADPFFSPPGQTTWARCLNDEQGGGATADIWAAGGSLWIYDYKTENKAVTSVLAMPGAHVEVLNGYVNMTEAPGSTPMIEDHGGSMTFLGFTNLGSAIQGPFTDVITQSDDAGSTTLTYDAGFGGPLPARGGTYAADFVIPFYLGGS